MPRGDKSKYTDKQKHQAEHIEEGYEHRGVSDKEAERRAWATVNSMTKGAKSRAARAAARKRINPPRRKAAISAERLAHRPAAAKKASAKKAAATRARHKKGG